MSLLFKGLVGEIKRAKLNHIDHFVQLLAQLRTIRGQVTSLKELRYVELSLVEEYEQVLSEQNELLSNKCVNFLLKEKALQYYTDKIDGFNKNIEKLKKVVELNQLEEEVLKTSKELEMLIEIVSNLKIEDATQTTKIINNIYIFETFIK